MLASVELELAWGGFTAVEKAFGEPIADSDRSVISGLYSMTELNLAVVLSL